MDELTLDNKKYLSSKQAAKVTGYAKDYVGQLCREGRIEARLVGRNWYVLESSILEHRFGPEEPKAADQEHIMPSRIQSSHVWETPRYIAEPSEAIPELKTKPSEASPNEPEAPEDNKVLLDMQSAWKEWFETQEHTEPRLPDASEMLLTEGDEASRPLDTSYAAAERAQEPSLSQEVPLHIVRSTEAHVQQVTEHAVDAPQVHIERIRPIEMRRLETDIVTTRSFIGTKPQGTNRKAVKSMAKRRQLKARKPRSFISNAVFLSVAGIAIAVAIIGSGIADNYLPTSGVGTFLTDFISGTHTIK